VRAAVYRRFGGPEVVELVELATPVPGRGELLIRVDASTVSAADHRSRARDIPAGLALPSSLVLGFRRPRRPVLGMDAAGVVAAVGPEVVGFAVGDRVVAMLGSRFGGHAEYAVVAASGAIVAAPRTLNPGEAASLVFGGITAQAFLRQASLAPGSRVLVAGASGAVGSAAVQLAVAAGAEVTGVTSAAHRDLVASLGAHRVVGYRTTDVAAEGERYDVVLDAVGTYGVERMHGALVPGGAVLTVATDLRGLLGAGRLARRYGIRVVTGPGPWRADDLAHVTRLADAGALRPVIERVLPFENIVEAHRIVDGGRKGGAVVLTITDSVDWS
jgi:NADPH:quinone reductase-like Zn-dependent oxidoreductase